MDSKEGVRGIYEFGQLQRQENAKSFLKISWHQWDEAHTQKRNVQIKAWRKLVNFNRNKFNPSPDGTFYIFTFLSK